jgi:hypothetical protein
MKESTIIRHSTIQKALSKFNPDSYDLIILDIFEIINLCYPLVCVIIDHIILLLHLMSIPLSSVFGKLTSRPIQE